MAGRMVHVRVGGQSYRVVTTASEAELQHLAGIVDQKLATVVPAGRAVTPQAMLLAAIALAHELEAERSRVDSIVGRTRNLYARLVERVDAALTSIAEGPLAASNSVLPDRSRANQLRPRSLSDQPPADTLGHEP